MAIEAHIDVFFLINYSPPFSINPDTLKHVFFVCTEEIQGFFCLHVEPSVELNWIEA